MRNFQETKKIGKIIEERKKNTEINPDWNINKKIKNKRGITLIALVVTIVILLILSGITIGTLMGDGGVIKKAQEAKKTTIVSVIKENIEIDKLGKVLEKEDGLITEDELKEILEKYGEIIYDEDGEIIQGIIEKDNGYEVLLPNIMDGVINQNIYVKLYTNGTLAFSNNKKTIMEGQEISKDYGNIKGKEYIQISWTTEEGIITNTPWFEDRNLITNAIFLDEIKPTSTSFWFTECGKLEKIETIENLNTKYVKNMEFMFAKCEELKELDVSKFDTRNVTSMKCMFIYCENLMNLDVSNFNTSNVTNMSGMFNSCKKLTSINVNNFNTSNVTIMGDMFRSCLSLTSIDVSNFNTSNATTMLGMFWGCTSLTSLDVSNFDTSNVTNMQGMFFGINFSGEIKGLEKFNTSKVTDMSLMFYECRNLTNINLKNFDTSNVTNMEAMFYRCLQLTNLGVSSFNTSKVTNMKNMFCECTNISTLDLSNFDTSKVTSMDYMFQNDTKLNTIYVGSEWIINNNTSTTNMFNGCGTSNVTVKQ